MNGILEEFAYGNVMPQPQALGQNAPYSRALALAARIEESLVERLGDDEKDLFEKYVIAQGEVNQLTAVNQFVHGYKLGLTMTADAFLGMDDLYLSGENF